MKRGLLAVVALAVAVLAAARYWPAAAAERAAFQADYAALKRFTESSYANLGDRLKSRRISPRELDAKTRVAIDGAHTRRAAREAIWGFVEAFDDHHFRAEAPYGAARKLLRRLLGKDRAREVETFAPDTAGADACAAFGARDRRGGEIAWAELPGWNPLPGDAATTPFPAGVVPREGAAPLAVLRIGLFSVQGFPDLCVAEWTAFRAGRSEACGEACQDEFWDRLEASFLGALERETRALAALGATTLVVDLAGNGGGSSIVTPMAKMLAPRALGKRRGGFIRHPHWAKRFAEEAAELRAELAGSALSAAQRAYVEAALARTEAMRREAETPCDLSGIWASESPDLPCSNVAPGAPYLDLPSPELVRGLATERLLLDAGQAPTSPDAEAGIWTGDVWIVTDAGTASASEDFVASLSDSGAARLVGETTMGIGCGYTSGGVSLELPGVGMTVKAPDCVRYRASGANEAEGIAPDVAIEGFHDLPGRERAAKVVVAISGR